MFPLLIFSKSLLIVLTTKKRQQQHLSMFILKLFQHTNGYISYQLGTRTLYFLTEDLRLYGQFSSHIVRQNPATYENRSYLSDTSPSYEQAKGEVAMY